MKGLVYQGPGHRSWQEVPRPHIQRPGDAIVCVDAVTICGTDLHILKGDVPEVPAGRILGHEAVGTVTAEQRILWESVRHRPDNEEERAHHG
jgi:alcohol dehydrogenase